MTRKQVIKLKLRIWFVYILLMTILTLTLFKIVEFFKYSEWIIIFLCALYAHHLLYYILKIMLKLKEDNND